MNTLTRPRSATIFLTQEEVDLCDEIARKRFLSSRKQGYGKFNYATSTPITIGREEEGVLGELAVARLHGMDDWVPEWRAADRRPDVAGFQVRATRYETGCLILRELDRGKEGEPFILAIVRKPKRQVRLAGVIMGGEAMVDEFLRRPDELSLINSWWVPQDRLSSVKGDNR